MNERPLDQGGFLVLGPPVVPFFPCLFLGEGSATKIDYRKEGYAYSNLATGGPMSWMPGQAAVGPTSESSPGLRWRSFVLSPEGFSS